MEVSSREWAMGRQRKEPRIRFAFQTDYSVWCLEEIERQISRQGGDLLGYIEILEGKYYYLDFSDAEAELREVFGSKQRGLGL